MANELYKYPLSRTQEKVFYEDGRTAVRCYSKSSPQYYVSKDSKFHPIDLFYAEDRNTTLGPITVAFQNVNSVGIRRDGEKYKYLGLRPDTCQEDGSEQIEFTLTRVVFDGQEVDFDTSKYSRNEYGIVDLGNVLIQSTNGYLKQVTKLEKCAKSFRIEKKIHLKNLRIEYKEKYNEFWVYNPNGEFRYRFHPPTLVHLDTFEPIGLEEDERGLLGLDLVTHRFEENSDGTYTYIKESGKDFHIIGVQNSLGVDAIIIYSIEDDVFIQHTGSTWNKTRSLSPDVYNGVAISTWHRVESYWPLGTYTLCRSFVTFDLVGLSGTVSDVSFHCRGNGSANGMYALGGLFDHPITTDAWDKWFGAPYLHMEVPTMSLNLAPNPFEAHGILRVQELLGQLLKLVFLEKTYDYPDSPPIIAIAPYLRWYNFRYVLHPEYEHYIEIEFDESTSSSSTSSTSTTSTSTTITTGTTTTTSTLGTPLPGLSRIGFIGFD